MSIAPALMDKNETAAYLGYSVRTVERMDAEGRLPGKRTPFGNSVRWSRITLDAWIASGCPEDVTEFDATLTSGCGTTPINSEHDSAK